MKIKKIIALGLAGCLILGSTVMAAPIEVSLDEQKPIKMTIIENAKLQTVKVTAKDIKVEEEYLEIAITYPVISGLTDAKFQEELNYFIEKQVTKAKDDIEVQAQEYVKMAAEEGWEIRPHQLFVEYDVKANNDDFLSFTMTYYTYTGGANGMTIINDFNIDKKANSTFHLKDLFKEGIDYKEVINKEVAKQIELRTKDEDKYFFEGKMGFQGIKDEQNFYLTDDKVVIFFEKYEIAPGAMGIPEFEISLDSLKDILKVKEDFPVIELGFDNITIKENGLDMVPLRTVAEKLGYTVTWDGNTQTVELVNGPRYTTVKIGENSYYFARVAPFTLEAAPVIIDNTTYVPVSFIERVLQ